MSHALVDFRCACGNERRARATRVRLGLVTQCAPCAKAAAAARGGKTRSLPEAERILRDRWSVYKANARAKGLPLLIDYDQARRLFTAPCDYCGGPGCGIDRIDSTLGYIEGNVAPCCSICNYAKRDMPRALFIDWIRRVHESLLQRDRQVLLRLVEQPDGRGPHHPRGDL